MPIDVAAARASSSRGITYNNSPQNLARSFSAEATPSRGYVPNGAVEKAGSAEMSSGGAGAVGGMSHVGGTGNSPQFGAMPVSRSPERIVTRDGRIIDAAGETIM